MDFQNYIDFTLLKPDATLSDIINLCSLAKNEDYYSVCVNPCWISDCKKDLKGTEIKISTVIGFPLGANTKAVKLHECTNAINEGADELDIVINIGQAKSGNFGYVKDEVSNIINLSPVPVKVIIESSILTKEEMMRMVQICIECNADFIKTSTGFNSSGVKLEDLDLIKSLSKDLIKIKASGGIKTLSEVKLMIKHGADRIGTSKLIREF